MSYVPIDELLEDVPTEHIVKYMTDEQMEQCYFDAYLGHIFKKDTADMFEWFVHHCVEFTDMEAEYVIEENIPQRFDGIPQSGKTYDAVRRIYVQAYFEGIEHAVSWMLGEVEYLKRHPERIYCK